MNTDAAAKLSLEINTGDAAAELTRLGEAYTSLSNSLKQGFSAIGGIDELRRELVNTKSAMKEMAASAQTEMAAASKVIGQLKDKIEVLSATAKDSLDGKVFASYAIKVEQGTARASVAIEGLTKTQVIEQAKSEAINKELVSAETEKWAQYTAVYKAYQAYLTGQHGEALAIEKAKNDALVAAETEKWAQYTTVYKAYQSYLDSQHGEALAMEKAKNDALVTAEKDKWAQYTTVYKAYQSYLDSQHGEALAMEKAKNDALVAAEKEKWDQYTRSYKAYRAYMDAEQDKQLAKDKAAAAWASKSLEEQLRAALPASRAISAGTNANLVHSDGAVALAQQLGSTKAVEDALSTQAALHKKLQTAVGSSTEAQLHWNNAAGEAHALARGLSGSLGTLWMTYGSIIPLLAGAAMGSGFVQAAKLGSDFAYQLTFVKALSEETAASIDMLSNSAIKLSTSGLYGPTEIASGYRILAQAGLEASQSLQAMPNVLNLATVGEMGMEQAATTLVGVMTAFNLTVGNSQHVGDVFAKAAALSQTSVQSMTEAMKTASVVGEQYGASLEDTATALTLLAKVNITGTAAGTSYRNMLKELYTPVPQAAAAIKNLGLATQDAMGNMRPFPDIIYDLKTKLQDFDKASQTQILQRIFGERGAKEAIVMLSKTREEWNSLKDAVTNSEGFMKRVADELENTVKGQWTAALNTMKSSLVTAFQNMEPAFLDLAQSFKSLFASQEFSTGLTTVVSALLELTGIVVKAAPALVAMAEAWLAVKVAMTGMAIISAIQGLGTSLTIVMGVMGTLTTGGIMANLSTALMAVGSSAGIAAGATGVGGLASAAALLATPAGPLLATVAVLAAVGGAMYLFRDRTAEAMEASTQKIVDFAKVARTELEDVAKTLGTTMASVSLAKLKGTDSALVAMNARLSDQKDTLSSKFNLHNVVDIKAAADSATTTSDTGGAYTEETAKYKAASAYLVALAERDKVAGQYFKLKQDAEDKAGYEATQEIARAAGTRKASDILGKDGKSADTDAYRSQMAELQNFVTAYESSYKSFVEETRKLNNEGQISEIQMIKANGEARVQYLSAEITKEQQAVALARSKGLKESDATAHLGKVEELEAKRARTVTETDNLILEAKESFNGSMLKLEADFNGKSETELQKAQAKLLGNWSKFMKEAKNNGDDILVERLNKMKTNLISAADTKDQMNKVRLIVSDFTSEIGAIEADMAKDGGWMAKMMGTDTIMVKVKEAKEAIGAEMEDLRSKMIGSSDDPSIQKQFASLKREYDKLANYVPQVWKDITKSIDGTVHDAFVKIFAKGKTDWKAFGQSIAQQLQTALLDAIYQVTVRKWVFSVIADVAGSSGWGTLASAAAAVAGGGSNGSGTNYMGLASNANSAYNLYNGTYAGYAAGAYNYGSTALGYTYGTNALSQQSLMLAAQDSGMSLGAGSAASTGATAEGGASMAGLGYAAGYMAIMYAVFELLTTSKSRYLDTTISGSMGENGFSGTMTDRYKNTGNLINDGSIDSSTRLLSGNTADISEFLKQQAGFIDTETLIRAGYLKETAVRSVLNPDSPNYAEEDITAARKAYLDAVGSGANPWDVRGGTDQVGFASNADYSRVLSDQAESGGIIKSAIESIYSATKLSLEGVAKQFDDNTVLDKLDNFSKEINIKFGGSIIDGLKVFGDTLAREMGSAWLPSIEGMRKSGEDWASALGRVIAESQTVSGVLDTMGKTMSDVFGKNNADNILRMSDSFVKLFGSVDVLSQSFDAYYQNFYSDAEKSARAMEALGNQFAAFGIAVPESRDAFRALVEAQDLNTTAGQETFHALMSLQSAFANLVPAIGSVTTSALAALQASRAAAQEGQASQIAKYMEAKRAKDIAAKQALIDSNISAAQASASSAQSISSEFKSILDSLTKYRQNLVVGTASPLSPNAKYALAKQDYMLTASKAKLGDKTAAGDLQSVSDTFLAASKEVGTALSYATDFGTVLGNIDSVIGTADRQVSIADQALQVAQLQLASLESIKAELSNTTSAKDSGLPSLINDYQQATKDWNDWFDNTAIGSSQQYSAGTTTRLSSTKGMFSDLTGNSYVFDKAEGFYSLAEQSKAWADELVKRYGAWSGPAFASGGSFGGGVRLVGENGPELEFTGPSHIASATDTISMLSGGGALIEELRALREEVAMMRADQRASQAAIASNTGKTAKQMQRWDGDGMPATRSA